MELGVSHEQSLSSLTPVVDNIFDKYNKNLVPIRFLSDHDTTIYFLLWTLNFFLVELFGLQLDLEIFSTIYFLTLDFGFEY